MKFNLITAAALAVSGLAVVAYFKSRKTAPPAAADPIASSLAMESWDNAPLDPIFSSAAAAALTTAQAAPGNTAHLAGWGIADGGSW